MEYQDQAAATDRYDLPQNGRIENLKPSKRYIEQLLTMWESLNKIDIPENTQTQETQELLTRISPANSNDYSKDIKHYTKQFEWALVINSNSHDCLARIYLRQDNQEKLFFPLPYTPRYFYSNSSGLKYISINEAKAILDLTNACKNKSSNLSQLFTEVEQEGYLGEALFALYHLQHKASLVECNLSNYIDFLENITESNIYSLLQETEKNTLVVNANFFIEQTKQIGKRDIRQDLTVLRSGEGEQSHIFSKVMQISESFTKHLPAHVQDNLPKIIKPGSTPDPRQQAPIFTTAKLLPTPEISGKDKSQSRQPNWPQLKPIPEQEPQDNQETNKSDLNTIQLKQTTQQEEDIQKGPAEETPTLIWHRREEDQNQDNLNQNLDNESLLYRPKSKRSSTTSATEETSPPVSDPPKLNQNTSSKIELQKPAPRKAKSLPQAPNPIEANGDSCIPASFLSAVGLPEGSCIIS